MAYLQSEDGDQISLTHDGITIGRDESNDVTLEQDMRVSRSHAQITNRDGQWVLTDLGSRNGTFINARAISTHPLRDADQVRIGSFVWSFHSGPDVHATEAATDMHASEQDAKLTDREVDVLKLVSDGFTDKEIAQKLQISVNTVRSHLDRIGKKTGLRKRSELTRLALGLHLDTQRYSP